MLLQKRRRIRTHQIGIRKERSIHTVETLMLIAAFCIVPAQLASIAFGWSVLFSGAHFTGFCIGMLGDIIFLLLYGSCLFLL